MKPHTNNFKNAIKNFGKEIDIKITYTLNGQNIELGNNDINSVSSHYEGSILKSVMKQLDIDSNINIPLETILKCQLGVKVNNVFEYMDLGNYIVYSSEKQEDTRSYKLICYDKMLYAMKDYENVSYVFPMTIRSYLTNICNTLGLTFKNSSNIFPNYDKQIPIDRFLDANGNYLGYTFREVLDQISEVVAGTICINKDDKLEIRYITTTDDTINEEFLKDVNVNFGEKYGPINSIVLSRANADNVYLKDDESIEENGLCEVKIVDNQIMSGDDREDFLPDILSTLDGLEYYINDFSSTGIVYYDLCDEYSINIDNNTYNCIMFNDEINIKQGLEELVYTDLLEQSETDYTKSDKTERKINRALIEVDKQQAEINILTQTTKIFSDAVQNVGSITLSNAYKGTLHRLEITGNIYPQYPSNNLYPSETLHPIDTYLVVDSNKYLLDIDYLSYTSSEEHDTYVYEEGKQWIKRADGTIEESNNEILIEVDKNSTIRMENFSNAIIKTIYLLDNDYTSTFTNQMDIVSQINLTPGNVAIKANKIKLEGYTTINNGFGVDENGNMFANNGTFSGDIYLQNENKVIGGDGLLTNLQFVSNGYLDNGFEPIGFREVDYYSPYAYADIKVDAYIPENFKIMEAYLTLYTSGTHVFDFNSQYIGDGICKQLKIYKGDKDYVDEYILAPSSGYSRVSSEINGSEIVNAFGEASYSPILTTRQVATKKSENIKDSLGSGRNIIFVRTSLPKPTYTPQSLNTQPYLDSGLGKIVLDIIGYMAF